MAKTRKSFSAYRDEIRQQLISLQVAESLAAPEETAIEPDEYLAQYIWFDSLFIHQNLKTDDGRPLEILHPGCWNRGEGPDFTGAKLRIGDTTLSGDVEIHLYPSGWRQHRHHLNPAYDSVILHACLHSEPDPAEVRNTKGNLIPSVVMEPFLFPDLDTIRQTTHLEDYPCRASSAMGGRCQPVMANLDDEYLAGLLQAAGRERMETKVRRFCNQAMGESLNQVFYQAVMTSMGLKSGKSLFFLLSKRAPVDEMLDYVRDIEPGRETLFFQSVLLNVPQMIPPRAAHTELDPEGAAFAEEMLSLFQKFSGYYADRIIPATKRWNTGVRPVNFAHRRLAGVAHLLTRWFLRRSGIAHDAVGHFAQTLKSYDAALPLAVKRRWIVSNLVNAFLVDDDADFWAWRYTLQSRAAQRPMKLIGESRAESIVLNALLPVLFVYAREKKDSVLEDKTWDLYAAFPPLESNSIVRHMRQRLFGDSERSKALLDSEARQQALFHIFSECCNLNELSCDDCAWFASHSKSNVRP